MSSFIAKCDSHFIAQCDDKRFFKTRYLEAAAYKGDVAVITKCDVVMKRDGTLDVLTDLLTTLSNCGRFLIVFWLVDESGRQLSVYCFSQVSWFCRRKKTMVTLNLTTTTIWMSFTSQVTRGSRTGVRTRISWSLTTPPSWKSGPDSIGPRNPASSEPLTLTKQVSHFVKARTVSG